MTGRKCAWHISGGVPLSINPPLRHSPFTIQCSFRKHCGFVIHCWWIFLFTDGHAVPVGYYDALVKELRLVGKGNLWPGTAKNAVIFSPLRPAFIVSMDRNAILCNDTVQICFVFFDIFYFFQLFQCFDYTRIHDILLFWERYSLHSTWFEPRSVRIS